MSTSNRPRPPFDTSVGVATIVAAAATVLALLVALLHLAIGCLDLLH